MHPLLMFLWMAHIAGSTTTPTQGLPVFRVLNAFQIVCAFAGLPFLISWLSTNPFPYAGAAFWSAITVYVVIAGCLTAATASGIKNLD